MAASIAGRRILVGYNACCADAAPIRARGVPGPSFAFLQSRAAKQAVKAMPWGGDAQCVQQIAVGLFRRQRRRFRPSA